MNTNRLTGLTWIWSHFETWIIITLLCEHHRNTYCLAGSVPSSISSLSALTFLQLNTNSLIGPVWRIITATNSDISGLSQHHLNVRVVIVQDLFLLLSAVYPHWNICSCAVTVWQVYRMLCAIDCGRSVGISWLSSLRNGSFVDWKFVSVNVSTFMLQ